MYVPWRFPRTGNASSNKGRKAIKELALKVWER